MNISYRASEARILILQPQTRGLIKEEDKDTMIKEFKLMIHTIQAAHTKEIIAFTDLMDKYWRQRLEKEADLMKIVYRMKIMEKRIWINMMKIWL